MRRYLISQHPEVEDRILQELAQHDLALRTDGSVRDIQYEDLGRLTYLNCVIKVTTLLPVLWCHAVLASPAACCVAFAPQRMPPCQSVGSTGKDDQYKYIIAVICQCHEQSLLQHGLLFC